MKNGSRRGARRPEAVPRDVLDELERGRISSVNHMEQMAMDQARLLKNVFPELSRRAAELRKDRFLDRMRAGARLLWETFGDGMFDLTKEHRSDTVRGWGAFGVGLTPAENISERFDRARIFADDEHFAVREWAWLGVRDAVRKETTGALNALRPWVIETSPLLRRFASEVTRPRSVWGSHLPVLKEDPWLAKPLLEILVVDGDRYVQTSVGNWLNDASVTSPGWVSDMCARWTKNYGSTVQWTCRRALRSISRSASVS